MQSMAYRSSVASSPGVSSHIPHNKRPVLLRVCHETIPINSHPKSIQSPPATQRHPAATSTTITPHTMQQNKRQCNSHEANEIWLFSSHEANEIWQTQRVCSITNTNPRGCVCVRCAVRGSVCLVIVGSFY
eukprot:1059485_1